METLAVVGVAWLPWPVCGEHGVSNSAAFIFCFCRPCIAVRDQTQRSPPKQRHSLRKRRQIQAGTPWSKLFCVCVCGFGRGLEQRRGGFDTAGHRIIAVGFFTKERGMTPLCPHPNHTSTPTTHLNNTITHPQPTGFAPSPGG